MSKRVALLAIGFLLAAGIVATLWIAGQPANSTPSKAAASKLDAPPEPHDSARTPTPAVPAFGALTDRSAESRETIDPPRLHGRVVDLESGTPIADAWVSWTSIPAGSGNAHAIWIDPTTITDRTVHASTGPDGCFAFEERPPDEAESVVWASAPGRESNAARWTGEARIGALDIALTPRDSIEVLVVDGSGKPTPGARVVHGAYTTPYDGVSDEGLRKALEVYRRESITDDGGRVLVPVHGGYQALWAETDLQRSSIWMDRAVGVRSVALRLEPTFELAVEVLSTDDRVDLQSLEIVVYRDDGGTLRFLARRPVDAWGTVEPFVLPVSSSSGYEISLRGGDVVPRIARIDAVRPGARASVELLAELGFQLPVKISTAEGAPIAGARATFQLQAEGIRANPFGQSDAEGLARIRGMASGSGFLFVDADGYRNLVSRQLQFSAPPEELLEVTLEPAGVLEGRCVSDDGPVRDFEIVAWAADGDPSRFVSRVFDDRADGSFRFDDVPTGDILALAFSAKHGLPRCDAVAVRVERNASGWVELKLPAPLLGRGRLIDVTTGEAPEGGFVQLWANHGGQLQRPAGDAITIAGDGRFELNGFGPGDVRMQASAPGYSRVIAHARAAPGSVVEFGTIGIAPLQSLEIELSAENGHEGGPYEISLSGQEWHPIQVLKAGGAAVFLGVSPGRWGIRVRGGGIDLESWRELLPGRVWRVSIPVSGTSGLLVRLLPRAGVARPTGWSVEARALGLIGDRTLRMARLSDDGEARFAGLAAGRYALFLLDDRMVERGSVEVDVRGVDASVSITPADTQFAVRVVSPQGRPLSGVHIELDGAEPQSPWGQANETGTDGTCTFAGVPAGEYVFGLWHAEFGWRLGIPVRVGDIPAPLLELAFEASYALRVRLMEGGEPRPGIQVHVRDAAGRYPLVSQVSDDEGRITHPSLARGRYLLVVDQPGYLPTRRIVELDGSRGEATLDVRSTGALSVTVGPSASGASLAVRIGLIDAATGSRVEDWLDEGRITSSTGSMTCDPAGRLDFSELPSGTYLWRLSGGDAVGEVIVPRRGRAQVEMPLP